MADLTTHYLGLELANPIVPSSSPLTRNLDDARRLEDAGASALVMHSLFEEEIHHEDEHLLRFMHHQSIGHAEAESFHPVPDTCQTVQEEYLEQLQQLKSTLGIPVIASLNGVSDDGWVSHGKALEQAGADALELNVYYIAASFKETATEVEQRYINLLKELKQQIGIPVVMKLSSQFSALANFVSSLEQVGADGISLFNRFYQPDIDLETLQVTPQLELSTSAEALLRIRWIAILRGQVSLSLAATGGVHTVEDVLKTLLAGADVSHMCSELLQNGPQRIQTILKELDAWLEEHEYSSITQLKGSVRQECALDPAAYERANYMSILDSYTSSSGVKR